MQTLDGRGLQGSRVGTPDSFRAAEAGVSEVTSQGGRKTRYWSVTAFLKGCGECIFLGEAITTGLYETEAITIKTVPFL